MNTGPEQVDHSCVVWCLQIPNQKPPTGRESLAYRRQSGDTSTVGVRSAPAERVFRPVCRSNHQTSSKPYTVSANSPPAPYKKRLWLVWLSVILGTVAVWLFAYCQNSGLFSVILWKLALSWLHWHLSNLRIPCLSYSFCICGKYMFFKR